MEDKEVGNGAGAGSFLKGGRPLCAAAFCAVTSGVLILRLRLAALVLAFAAFFRHSSASS